MSGYFARVLQQTGISIAGTSDGTLEVLQPSSATSFAGNDAVTPMQIEQDVVINAQPELMTEDLTAEVESNRLPPNTPKPETMPTPNILSPERIPELQPHSDLPKLTVVNVEESQPASENLRPQPDIVVRESINQVVSTNSSRRSITDTPPTVETLTKETQADSTEADFPSPLISEQVNSYEIQQVYWQAVRDWVTGTPEVEEGRGEREMGRGEEGEKIQNSIFSSSQSPTPNPQPPILNPQSPTPIAPNPHSLRSWGPRVPQFPIPEVQEFSLSIGTISITIEEPPKELPKPMTLNTQSEPFVKPEPQSSRLNRHYLRLR
ncbi:hypothetical protein [Fischerella sp. PCC 9605]|uniref:hypothetical protein n=1 Tax=Fischerella sp. PCC 9605 TaxID=1173024 RepID=UPI00047CFF3F|nr:hypothetical protein [Fischerella sp. PCC 9605]